MTRKIFIAIGSFALVILVLLIGMLTYYFATYVDQTITEGEAFGFNIGSSKKEAYASAREIFVDIKVYILHPIDKSGYGPHKRLNFSEQEFTLLNGKDEWSFYLTTSFLDFYKLEFINGQLASVYRHKQIFEFP